MSDYIDDPFSTIYCKYNIITYIAMMYAEQDKVLELDFYNKVYSYIYDKIQDLGAKLLNAKANGNPFNDEDYKSYLVSYLAYNFILYSDYYAGYCLDLREPQEQPLEFFIGYFPIHYLMLIYTSLHNILKTYINQTNYGEQLLQNLPNQLFEIVKSNYNDDGKWFFESINYHLPTHFLTDESLIGVKECIKLGTPLENMSGCLDAFNIHVAKMKQQEQEGVEACLKLQTPEEDMPRCLHAYKIHIAAPAAGGSIINNIMNKSKGKKLATKTRKYKSQKQKNQRKHKTRKYKSQKQKNRRKHKSRKHKSRIPKQDKAL